MKHFDVSEEQYEAIQQVAHMPVKHTDCGHPLYNRLSRAACPLCVQGGKLQHPDDDIVHMFVKPGKS